MNFCLNFKKYCSRSGIDNISNKKSNFALCLNAVPDVPVKIEKNTAKIIKIEKRLKNK